MSGRTMNVAIAGAGAIGQFHAETIGRRVPGVRLAAVADPRIEQAEQAARFGDGSVCAAESLEAALSQVDIDAVVIATPARFHRGLVEVAAQAGKHIFCEKPVALTLEDARAAVDAATTCGVLLQIGFQRRFDASYTRAHRAIAAGEIGKVEMLISTTRDPDPPKPGQLERAGGVYLDTAIHDFDSVRFLSGEEVIEVYATASTLITTDRSGIYDIDTTAIILRLRSGALATVTSTLRTGYGYEAGAEVFGSEGKIVISSSEEAGVQVFAAGNVATAYPQTYHQRFGAAYRAEIADFARCITEGDRPRVGGEDGLRSVEIALAATRSQREGVPVKL